VVGLTLESNLQLFAMMKGSMTGLLVDIAETIYHYRHHHQQQQQQRG